MLASQSAALADVGTERDAATMSTTFSSRMRTSLAIASMAALSLPTQALIRSDDSPDLVFVLWDSVAKVSYTRDLGLDANAFWAYAQQDQGYSYDYKLAAADPALIAFRTASTTTANQRWAVFAFDSGPSLATSGDTKAYTTLAQGPSGGTVNPNWTDMTNALSGDVMFTAREMPNRLYFGLNFSGTDPTQYTRATGENGTSFDKEASKGYFAGKSGFSAQGGNGNGSYLAGVYNVVNQVNQSSWFYYLTNATGSDKVVVDEFDNLSSNGYWGLALGTDNLYRLTFTQAATQSGVNSATTDLGLQRVSVTDYAAGGGAARLLTYTDAVSAVPEPGTWALFALGIAGLIGRSRLRR